MTETKSLAEALALFQAELPKVAKDNRVDAGAIKYDYADLAAVSHAVLPALAKHGLSFLSRPTVVDGRFVLAYKLLHTSGESEAGEFPLPDKGSSQQMGSAITYARRYALSAVTGVAPDKDDDGASASETRVEARPRREPEKSWDPIEQDTYLGGYLNELEAAEDDEAIAEIGARVGRAKTAGDLSPATVAKLKIAAGKRKGELNGGGHVAG